VDLAHLDRRDPAKEQSQYEHAESSSLKKGRYEAANRNRDGETAKQKGEEAATETAVLRPYDR